MGRLRPDKAARSYLSTHQKKKPMERMATRGKSVFSLKKGILTGLTVYDDLAEVIKSGLSEGRERRRRGGFKGNGKTGLVSPAQNESGPTQAPKPALLLDDKTRRLRKNVLYKGEIQERAKGFV